MAKLTINTGTSNDAGNGDSLRTAFTKINDNFTELYTLTGNNSTAAIKDIKGSVFGDDSTTLVDSVASSINIEGTVKGNIIPDAVIEDEGILTDITYFTQPGRQVILFQVYPVNLHGTSVWLK